MAAVGGAGSADAATAAVAAAADGAAVEFPVNDEGWPLAPEGYEMIMEVGQGAFATVWKARCPSKDMQVRSRSCSWSR